MSMKSEKLLLRAGVTLRERIKKTMEYFAGAHRRFGRKSFVMRRALLVVLCSVAFCFPVAAGQAITLDQVSLYRPQILSTADCSTLLQSLPMLTLLDARDLPAPTELGQMGTAPIEFASDVSYTVAEMDRIIVRPDHSKDSAKDVPAEAMNPPSNPIYYGGEVGFLYGHSSGKFGGDLLETYMLGTVGDDKFQITVGASHEESNQRIRRWTR
jgi:hypothetical protein